ncbi:MAG: pyruvate dehydrogenase complex dihydrolipoamide acetyltransferase [Rhodospirillales bacterium]|nr:pyruvate dehydrogenase complex dihydrolipoamide acetyltransferase [Rhodospirillales bacterium]MCB9995650.1 pyruvate dehydrogenase complex dihydrolipoamide acetyltransferase [Rhodospirillales bacterium]
MPTNILMPALSPTMTEGTLAKWHKSVGDTVAAGDVIAEIETDKATMEVEAVDEGTLGKILIDAGTEGVAVNQPIAILLEEGESESDITAVPSPSHVSGAGPSLSLKGEGNEASPSSEGGSAVGEGKTVQSKSNGHDDKGDRIFASPLARRIAGQKGIDLSAVKGSGPHGRIIKADVEVMSGGAVSHQAPAAAAQPAAPAIDARQIVNQLGMAYTEIPNNNIKKITAKRLLESKQTVPHFYLTIEMQIDALLAARKQINEQANGAYKLSVNDFIIKACANALQAYPAANVSWTDEAVLQYANADISVAVSTPNGLMTPIVKAAEGKGLRQISEEVKDLAGRARENKLKPEEFQGGTFTVSNLGMFGIKEFGAIINPPQACILAVGAGEEKPYVSNGEIKIGTFMTCTLSVDHRAVDGAVGAEYLQILKQYIENPVSMLV